MAKSAKPKYGVPMNEGQRVKLRLAYDNIYAYYNQILAVWNKCTPEQKQAYLADSPMLKELLDWGEQWRQ